MAAEEPFNLLHSLREETESRQWLYCRLIGGPASGEIIEASKESDVYFVPIFEAPHQVSLDCMSKPPYKRACYVRSHSTPTYFYFKD